MGHLDNASLRKVKENEKTICELAYKIEDKIL